MWPFITNFWTSYNISVVNGHSKQSGKRGNSRSVEAGNAKFNKSLQGRTGACESAIWSKEREPINQLSM